MWVRHSHLLLLIQTFLRVVLGDNPTWATVFDETKEMPGHQTKYQHILDRTYLRPRDMIKFTNSVLKQYKVRVTNNNAVASQFENVDLNNARGEYSNYLMNELDDEIHKHLPHYEELIELLRSVGVWQYTLEDLNNHFTSNDKLAAGRNLKDVVQELYDFSLIGFYRPGGRGYGGSEYVFKYKEPRTRLDPAATRLRTHPGLIEVLGLKRFTVGAPETGEETV